MRTAIVTGANGFIGKAMVRFLLSKGFFVNAIVTNEDEMKDIACPELKTVVAFFNDYELVISSFPNADYLFHFAWQGVFGEAFKDYSLQLGNAIFAAKTFEYASKAGIKKFILASTANVLETKKQILEESPRLRTTSIYGTAKLAAEMICKTLAANKPMKFNCCYIAMAYGENNRSLMVPNVVMSSLLQGVSPKLIEGNGLYDLVYIDDIVEAFYSVAEKGINSKTYYIGHKELTTFKSLFSEIGKIINPSVPLCFGAYPDTSDIDYGKIDLGALEKDTGFVCHAEFRSSILNTAEWIKQSNYLKGEKQ